MLDTRTNTEAEEKYLDAARACILDVGVRRTTLTDIARRAGIARMTLYRSWPDMISLLADLMVREWLEGIDPSGLKEEPDPVRLTDFVMSIVQSMNNDPLFRKIVEVDHEFLHPYVFQKRGRIQEHLLTLITPELIRGQEAGTIASGNPEAIARTILMACQGHIMSLSTMTDTVTSIELEIALRAMIERYLRP